MTSTNFNIGMNLDRASSKDDKNCTSSDSEDDEDYVPSSKELKDEREASEENTDDSQDEEVEGGSRPPKRRRATSGRSKKRAKLAGRSARQVDEQEQEQEQEEGDDEAEAKSSEPAVSANIDDLWNEFKKDVQTAQPKVSKAATTTAAATEAAEPAAKCEQPERPSSGDSQPSTKTVTEIFEFAGEAVEVRKEVPVDAPVAAPAAAAAKPRGRACRGGAAGLSSVLGQIGKKNKLSVLEKSKLDWDTFKQAEGIQEDLQTHNRGKEGYLEKQDFLQRTDLRQFELEKAMRTNSRRAK